MAKTITTKYGTKINVDGLTPQQVAKVRSIAEDKGAYGTKGAALADSLRKQNTKTVKPGGKKIPDMVNNDGTIKEGATVKTVLGEGDKDESITFNRTNPGTVTDIGGNTRTIVTDPETGATTVKTEGGAAYKAGETAFINAATGLGGDGRVKAQDAVFNYMTKDYATQKAQEMEAAKQELANRGIPLDPSPGSLYGRTLAEIDKKYQGLYDQAKNQSITAGNEYYATDVGAVSTLGTVTQGFKPDMPAYTGVGSNNAGNLTELLGMISQSELAKYGIDQETMTKLKAIAASKSGGGGGSGGTDTSPVIGGTAP